MSRLAAVRPADATSAQKKVIDAIAGGARGRDRALDSLFDERGGLAGPFNAWVHRPDLGIVVQRLGERLRFHGSLPGAAREIAILAVGAKWMAARAHLGDGGLVELVTLVGYYTLVSFTLNAFEVPLPAGESYAFEDGR